MSLLLSLVAVRPDTAVDAPAVFVAVVDAAAVDAAAVVLHWTFVVVGVDVVVTAAAVHPVLVDTTCWLVTDLLWLLYCCCYCIIAALAEADAVVVVAVAVAVVVNSNSNGNCCCCY